jgi:hypothetical protein
VIAGVILAIAALFLRQKLLERRTKMGKIDDEKTVTDGYVMKSAELSVQEVSDEDMKKINKYALSPLKAEDVFVFKTIVGDNELDDRNFEPFNANALKDLEKLYAGKPVIKDHRRSADNQVARIYDTELITDESKQTGAGEPHTELMVKCYMVKTDTNADLIAEIKGGIKKEVSTGCRPNKAICSICGVDNAKTWCAHYPGREYETDQGKKTCYFTLDGAKEAYELSLVAVPAQPRAGTCKNYGGAEPEAPAQEAQNEAGKTADETEKEVLTLKINSAGAFLFAKNHEFERKD